MWNQGKREKCCLTCANWGGPRQLGLCKRAETSDPGVRGKCYCGMPGSALPGPSACEGRSCPKYQLWAPVEG